MTAVTSHATRREALRRLLDGEHAEIRDAARAWLEQPGHVGSAARRLKGSIDAGATPTERAG